uniref:Uncharacterized protein n=1 Tax=Glossina pallidipes TaxID=7398 RepID=A0A1B0A432_GLOPL
MRYALECISMPSMPMSSPSGKVEGMKMKNNGTITKFKIFNKDLTKLSVYQPLHKGDIMLGSSSETTTAGAILQVSSLLNLEVVAVISPLIFALDVHFRHYNSIIA